MKINSRQMSRNGYQVVLHGNNGNGKKFSLTVHTDRTGKVNPETIKRVKRETGIELPANLF